MLNSIQKNSEGSPQRWLCELPQTAATSQEELLILHVRLIIKVVTYCSEMQQANVLT